MPGRRHTDHMVHLVSDRAVQHRVPAIAGAGSACGRAAAGAGVTTDLGPRVTHHCPTPATAKANELATARRAHAASNRRQALMGAGCGAVVPLRARLRDARTGRDHRRVAPDRGRLRLACAGQSDCRARCHAGHHARMAALVLSPLFYLACSSPSTSGPCPISRQVSHRRFCCRDTDLHGCSRTYSRPHPLSCNLTDSQFRLACSDDRLCESGTGLGQALRKPPARVTRSGSPGWPDTCSSSHGQDRVWSR